MRFFETKLHPTQSTKPSLSTSLIHSRSAHNDEWKREDHRGNDNRKRCQ